MAEFINVIRGGRTFTKDGDYDCERQQGKIISISFTNEGNTIVNIVFGGSSRTLPPPGGRFSGATYPTITFHLNVPYVDKTVYRIQFDETGVERPKNLLIITEAKVV